MIQNEKFSYQLTNLREGWTVTLSLVAKKSSAIDIMRVLLINDVVGNLIFIEYVIFIM